MKILKLAKNLKRIKPGKITCQCGCTFKYNQLDCYTQCRWTTKKSTETDALTMCLTETEQYWCVRCPVCGFVHDLGVAN